MASLGGYFAVSYVAEQVFAGALDALWRTEWEQGSGPIQWSANTPLGRIEATGGFALDKPSMAFRGAANAIEVRLTGCCRVAVTLAGVNGGGVLIAFDALASLPVIVTQEAVMYKAVVDLTAFTLDSSHLRLTWFDGPHGPNTQTALLGPEARASLAAEVRKRAERYLKFRLPTDRVYAAELAVMLKGNPGSVIFTPLVKLGNARILDGWMALGIDATSGIASTSGNAAAIGPPPAAPPPGAAPMPQADPGNGSLRLIVDPALALAYLLANANFAVTMASASRPNLHPDMNSIRVTLEDDTVVLQASGSVDAPDPFPGTMPFGATVRIRPFIPKNTSTVYASIKPDVRVDAPWYLEVLGAIADFFGGDSFAQLKRANKSQMATLFGVAVKSQKVPETFGVYASLEGRQVAIRSDLLGIYGETRVSTTFSEPDLAPTPAVQGGIFIRDRFLRLQLTSKRLIADPTFRVQYRIKRGSNGTEVASGTTWSGSDQAFGATVDLWDDANVLETHFSIELVAERPPGTVVATKVQPLQVVDPLDRSHPFVRWRKLHYFTGGGTEPRPILSAVHKTAVRERCKFCDVREGRFGTPYVMQALDTLPAPEQEGFSTRLCEYCFPT